MEVRSCAELAAALNDTGVHHIDVLPIPREEGGYDCDADVLPPGGFLLTDRALLLEGRGPEKVYFNVSRLTTDAACRCCRLCAAAPVAAPCPPVAAPSGLCLPRPLRRQEAAVCC